MLVKEWNYNDFLSKLLNYKSILIHGVDRGKVDEKSNEIFNILNKKFDNLLEKIDLDLEQFKKSNSYLYEILYQKSFFSKMTLIKINLDLIKVDKEFIEITENIDIRRCNFLVLESKYLPNSSSLVNIFRKINYFALIPCYQDVNVKDSIVKYVKKYSLKLEIPKSFWKVIFFA